MHSAGIATTHIPPLCRVDRVIVIIDAFRAFATACYILEQAPSSYYLTDRCTVVSELQKVHTRPLLIGKPEKGSSLQYCAPNSPSRVRALDCHNRVVIHRTAAGGKGVRLHRDADYVLAASFLNADATANFLLKANPKHLALLPMGHEANTPSIEDDLCAAYISSLLQNSPLSLDPYLDLLKKGPGHVFFGPAHPEYPRSDFDHCLLLNAFAHPIFVENLGDFSRLFIKGAVASNDATSSSMT